MQQQLWWQPQGGWWFVWRGGRHHIWRGAVRELWQRLPPGRQAGFMVRLDSPQGGVAFVLASARVQHMRPYRHRWQSTRGAQQARSRPFRRPRAAIGATFGACVATGLDGPRDPTNGMAQDGAHETECVERAAGLRPRHLRRCRRSHPRWSAHLEARLMEARTGLIVNDQLDRCHSEVLSFSEVDMAVARRRLESI